MADAKIIAQDNGSETAFKEQRRRKKNMMSWEICEDEVFGLKQEENFRDSLAEIYDKWTADLMHWKRYNSNFGFLSGSQINETDSKTYKLQLKHWVAVTQKI